MKDVVAAVFHPLSTPGAHADLNDMSVAAAATCTWSHHRRTVRAIAQVEPRSTECRDRLRELISISG